MKERDITFKITQCEDFPPQIIFESKLYELCLYNIVYNAIKFNKKGGMVEVKLDYDHQFRLLKTNVLDSGSGISEEKQKTLFHVFRSRMN